MRRSARIKGKHDEQNVGSDENSCKVLRKTRSPTSSTEPNKLEKKPLREIDLNSGVISSTKNKKNSNKPAENSSKVTRSGKHFSPYVISCDPDDGIKTVKTRVPLKKEKNDAPIKNKENTGKTITKRNARGEELEENKENLVGEPLQQLLEHKKHEEGEVTTNKSSNKETASSNRSENCAGILRKTRAVEKDPEDLLPVCFKDFPGLFLPSNDGLDEFDEKAIENSLTLAELEEIRETLKEREEISPVVEPKDRIKSDVMLSDSSKYGGFKSHFKDIKAQVVSSDAMFGTHVSTAQGRRPPEKFSITEEHAIKKNESKRLYRKRITDSDLMAWHRYNVATSSRYAPTVPEPRFILRYTRRKKPTTEDLLWNMNQKQGIPTVDEIFEDEERLAKMKLSEDVSRTTIPGSSRTSSGGSPGSGSLVFDPKEFTASTPVTKK